MVQRRISEGKGSGAGGRPLPALPLAISLCGGISLGAYFAGVTYELVRLLRSHPDRLAADVWAGASAGGMTAAIACYCLALERDPWPLYDAWVNQADMERLVAGDETSLLDHQYLQWLAERALPTEEPEIGDMQPRNRRALFLGLTVTNLNGLVGPPHPDSPVLLRNHAETRRFHLHEEARPAGAPEDYWKRLWEKIRKSARMCGAFPLSFPPVEDSSRLFPRNRRSANLRDTNLAEDLYEGSKGTYPVLEQGGKGWRLDAFYVDGGLVHNKPIGLAIDLVELWEKETGFPIPACRLVVVDAHKITSLDDGKVRRQAFDHLDAAEAAVTLAREQRFYEDLRLVYRRNALVRARERLRKALEKVLPPTTDRKLRAEIGKLMEGEGGICPYRHVDLDFVTPMDALRVHEIHRWLRPEIYKEILEWQVANSVTDWEDLAEEGWRDLESGLRTEDLIASDFLQNLGGFFDRSYRDYDFALGRLSIVGWLRRMATLHPSGPWGEFLPEDVLAYLNHPANLTPVETALQRLREMPAPPGRTKLNERETTYLLELVARGFTQIVADMLGRLRGEPDAMGIIRKRRRAGLFLQKLASELLKMVRLL